ncbi:MFS transporter [Streptomyces sp. NRRL WC-3742]|uniref:MFS transporter n=1 Tax=Streptomyces sp. NRRL WC-3742 TaxID=1463934 RepID=UPI0007C5187A|nr:MFS transporter [Streptomyces sp. NRRL WC-3742]
MNEHVTAERETAQRRETAQQREQPVPLRRNLRFQALWIGQASGTLGMMVGETAFPLLVLALTDSPSAAGAFGAVQMAVALLLGVHGGLVADRRDRRKVLIVTDAARLTALASVPVAVWLDRLTLVHLLLVAAAVGATVAYGGPIRLLALRSVVPPEQMRQALAQDEARMSGAALAGPPLAGFLFGLGHAVPFLGAALATTLSFTSAVVVRFPSPPAQEAKGGDGALAGFRVIAASPLLRAALGVLFLINLCGAALLLPVIVMLREQGAGSAGIGLTLAGEAVGALAGTTLVARLHRAAGPGVLLTVAAWVSALASLAPLLPGGAFTVFAALFVVGAATPALRVMLDLLVFRQVPDELRGRVIAATVALLTAGMPAGSFASGLLLDRFSPAATLVAVTALFAVALLPATFSRNLRRATWPATVSSTPGPAAAEH